MNEILKEFLNKDISREIYDVPSNIDEKELVDILEELKTRTIENGTFLSSTREHHTVAGENLGKGVIISFEFYGIQGALKFIKDVSIKAEEELIKRNKENNYQDLLEIDKKNLKKMKEILKDGIENIEKLLNEWE